MNQYHDFNYVIYILNLPYKEALEIYNTCIGRFNDNLLWDLFILELTKETFQGSFDDYKKMKNSNVVISQMTYKEKECEEKRIINKFKFVEKVIDIKSKRLEKN